eukprot:scaffold39923_cov64-Phaeocystis_antarctica.AAC.10
MWLVSARARVQCARRLEPLVPRCDARCGRAGADAWRSWELGAGVEAVAGAGAGAEVGLRAQGSGLRARVQGSGYSRAEPRALMSAPSMCEYVRVCACAVRVCTEGRERLDPARPGSTSCMTEP